MKALPASVLRKKLEMKGLGEDEINAILTAMGKISQTIADDKKTPKQRSTTKSEPAWLLVENHCPSCQLIETEKIEGVIKQRDGGTIFSACKTGVDMSKVTKQKTTQNYRLCSYCIRREKVLSELTTLMRTDPNITEELEQFIENGCML